MVRTAREEENLRSMSRSGGHSIRAPSNFNRGRTAFGGRVDGRFHSSGRSGIDPTHRNQRGRSNGNKLPPNQFTLEDGSRLICCRMEFTNSLGSPHAWAVNAFTFSWKHLWANAFPPFSLILRSSKFQKLDLVLVTVTDRAIMVPSCPGAHKRHPGNSASNRSLQEFGHRRDTRRSSREESSSPESGNVSSRPLEVAQLLLDGK
ncbi:hypothetical protein OUZ56_024193 [Daphnia magna]|uniref:Uncharacterized protein n=1 Tax=Daphnia magna TaxID=35525 RepID=A0ABR0B0B2_9CRUS|nr:hypothetical protein OUZ56_024193 [Daphnia magna]